MNASKTRERSESFLDHFSQARMFLHSQSGPERQHLVDACRFELGKVERLAIRERVIGLFQKIDADFAKEVASAIGVTLPAPIAVVTEAAARARDGKPPVKSSPALSLARQPKPGIVTRKVALLALPDVSQADVNAIRSALCGQGAVVEVVSVALGPLMSDAGQPIDVDETFLTTASVLYDAVVVPGGQGAAGWAHLAAAIHFVRECFGHAKPVGFTNEGVALLDAADLPDLDLRPDKGGVATTQGVVTGQGDDLRRFNEAFVDAIREHRHFDRNLSAVPI